MLPTPDTSHVPYSRVYEPAEDSYLMLDSLSSDQESSFLKARFNQQPNDTDTTNQQSPTPAPLVLEVGSGSGVVIAFVAAQAPFLFGTPNILTASVDVNAFACRATNATVRKASQAAGSGDCWLGATMGDLTAPLRRSAIDVLVFNPPYVPSEELPVPPPPSSSLSSSSRAGLTSAGSGLVGSDSISGPDAARHAPATTTTATTTTTNPSSSASVLTSVTDQTPTFDEDSYLLALSYAGGRDGMETTERLISSLPDVLSARGCAYVLLCAQNKPDEVKTHVRSLGPEWYVLTVGDSGKKAGWERLQIIRIWRDSEGEGGERNWARGK